MTADPGWYIDPVDDSPSAFRFWNGDAWTSRVSNDGETVGYDPEPLVGPVTFEGPRSEQRLHATLVLARRAELDERTRARVAMPPVKRVACVLFGIAAILARFVDDLATQYFRYPRLLIERWASWSLVVVALFWLAGAALIWLGLSTPLWYRGAAFAIGSIVSIVMFPLMFLAEAIAAAYGRESSPYLWLWVSTISVAAVSFWVASTAHRQ